MVAENSGQCNEKSENGRSVIHEACAEVGNKWRLILLYDLQGEEKRFNEIKRSTDMNSGTLSRTLDDLRELGFVTCRTEQEIRTVTYYHLTEKGESLKPIFDTLGQQFAGKTGSSCDSSLVEK